MNFFKIHKRPLISNDIKAQKDDIQDHYKEADKKLKNETAIIKSIILSKIESALEQVNIERDRLNEEEHFSNKHDSVLMDRISWNIGREQILIEFREYVKSTPDSLYRIQRKGSQVLEINGLDGSSFELYHLKEIIGGSIYQLKDNRSNQTVDIIEYNYLEKLEKTSENGYLFPDDNMIKALDQLR